MSKLVDKLEEISQPAIEPMGFRPGGARQQKARMLLVGSVERPDTEGLAERLAGADAGLLHTSDSNLGTKLLQNARKAVPDIPWGVRLTEDDGDGLKQLAEAGCDFVIFQPARATLEMLENENTGNIPEIESSLGEGMLRAINGLPADAVFLASEREGEYVLTWHHLMLFQRVAHLTGKPLLVWAPPGITVHELQAMLDAGVKGVVVETGNGETSGRLKEIRDKIGKLNSAIPHKKRKLSATVPRMVEETKPTPVEEEEEEGEDE
ncbi:MAG: hypothetical protein HYX79_05470 [Chloroflexi bacterium]|nr:hypothetical protein [Chloroflexota bacterium]